MNAAGALRALGQNQAIRLRDHVSWRFDGFDLVELPGPTVEAQGADSFGADLAVFLSRHRSASGKKCFTTHVTGNWDEALHGGQPRTLCRSSAFQLKRFYLALKEKTGNAYLEATHHGPTLSTPALFVETGSDEAEWKKAENGSLLAESVLAALERNDAGKVALGFGGSHYCPAFAPLLDQGWAFSHVASKHALDSVTEALFRQAVEKTVEPVDAVFLDKGSVPSVKRRQIEAWCDESGLSFEAV